MINWWNNQLIDWSIDKLLLNYYGDCFVIYAILVFWSDYSSCELFQILWILHSRPLSFDAQYFTPDKHRQCTRYTSLSTPDLTFPSRALMYLIVYQNQNFQNVYPLNPVAIGLPAFGFHYLAITLAIKWKSWHLIIRRGGRLHLTGFSTSPPIVAPKGGKPHVIISKQSVDRLDNLSYVCITKCEYTFWVTYVLVAATSFYLNRWRHRYDGAELYLEKNKCGNQYQDLLGYLSRDFNSEDHDITVIKKFILKIKKNYMVIFNEKKTLL